MILRVLIAALCPGTLATLRAVLGAAGGASVVVTEVADLDDARRQRDAHEILLLGAGLLGESAVRAVAELAAGPEAPDVVVLGAVARPTELLAAGATLVLDDEAEARLLAGALERVLARRRRLAIAELGRGERRSAAGGPTQLADATTESPAMRRFLAVARKVVPTATAVLLTGETGVGKERCARAIHAEGPRAALPFVAVNCAAIPESLIEAELFGHARGAFTGATGARRGYFELAHGGTLFLDEIGDLPVHLQGKLLRVLQEREVRPVGSEAAIQVDVRVLSATNRDLAAEVAAERFREDLFYRLSVVTLRVPPLRERPEDLPALIAERCAGIARELGRPVLDFAPEARAALLRYAWPGNVRELGNVLERAVLLCEGERIEAIDLPDDLLSGDHGEDGAAVGAASAYLAARAEASAGFDRAYFADLLRRARGRVGRAAELAGLSPRSVYEKMQRLGLRKEDFRL
jgi:DNA-binding NtrC family response regulator